MITNKQQTIEFLKKLSDLCAEYDAGFRYTNKDDGIHIRVGYSEVKGYINDVNEIKTLIVEITNVF